ncbi:heterochromatin protein 1-binding protein 3-like isoform X1 [Oncorhynchus kisutch]|uniref:Heterochromatin protein 1-binding protein 3 n=2 Tax=Oncorhynchus kisutch TaxID=8019 RepID=A0A8C7MV29_ONCKI|nr:heterochromatin protein 1-binding protein 3-like isoform X1 [Oncorhynchus kisutch]XP_031680936.1 heterochromatin protein 1-binding protein 3-like isoform X1 [Oncorhynchus kisutch]XP_031680937.1 heterochromatin protein 1-binding protein 3-like isoform X1 [Oncorhynchus kisutch]
MPIRRAARTPPQEMPPSAAPEGEPDASSEESASVEEEQEMASAALVAKEGEGTGEGETKENGEKSEGEKGDESTGEKTAEGEESEKKEEKDGVKEKVKKPVKRAIPAWATMSASKRATLTNKSTSTMQLPKMDDILIEAIESCKEKTGASAHSVMKYIVKKYPILEKRKFLLKKALKRQLEKGTVKQLKGKGLSGSFTIGKQSSNKPPAKGKPIVVAPGLKAETLGDALPLIITRLCEPKEASYILIKKYVEQHFPQLNVEHRPDILKSALVRAVDKGHLEQITGKGASGTFQLKREGGKFLLKGGPLEDAIMTAIVAMNEPKTCSTTTLRKFLLETNQDSMEYRVVNNLKRTLQKCKMMGWMDQITGNGLNGTYQLCYPYYPSPAILFPEKQNVKEQKVAEKDKRRKRVDLSDEDSDEEEEDSSEEEDSDDEPPPKRKAGKRPPPKARRPPPSKKSRPASQSRAKGKKRAAPAKRSAPPAKKSAPPAKKSAPPAKKSAPPAKKSAPPAKKSAPPAKRSAPPAKRSAPPPVKVVKAPPPVKAPSPVKKAAPASKPKTPIIKKLMSKASKRPTPKKSPPAKKAAANSAVKAKPAARKSLRGKK